MLQARRRQEGYPPVGTFSHLPAVSRTLRCDHADDTVVHNSPDVKNDFTMTWTPGTESVGDLVFVYVM